MKIRFTEDVGFTMMDRDGAEYDETFQKGELIAVDAGQEIRSPCDDCTIFMPTRAALVGREGVYLTVAV